MGFWLLPQWMVFAFSRLTADLPTEFFLLLFHSNIACEYVCVCVLVLMCVRVCVNVCYGECLICCIFLCCFTFIWSCFLFTISVPFSVHVIPYCEFVWQCTGYVDHLTVSLSILHMRYTIQANADNKKDIEIKMHQRNQTLYWTFNEKRYGCCEFVCVELFYEAFILSI